jgi:hypothetical protein
MQAHVTKLCYWKSEHNAETNEDAVCFDVAAGLFAVADGVGSASFSNIWADILVKHFVAAPLMSDDPFEIEWWLRRAQSEYAHRTPRVEDLPAFAQEKAREGSQSTLVSLRIEHIEAETAKAHLLGFGDSCAFVYRAATDEIEPFPIAECRDFDRPPICLPSRPGDFDPGFHRCQARLISLATGDIVILASDAVARWLWCNGAGEEGSPLRAFRKLAAITSEEAWIQFVNLHRHEHTMRDDDATALIIRLTNHGDGQPLGCTPCLPVAVVRERRQALEEARSRRNNVEMAIHYGDGRWLDEGERLSEAEITHARRVAIGKHAVINAIRKALRTNQNVQLIVEPVWREYEDVLQDEPSLAALHRTLAGLGIAVQPLSPEKKVLVDLRRALANDDDDQIIVAIRHLWPDTPSFLDDVPDLSEAERQRITLAFQREESLRRLREALASDDDRNIVASYDPILDGYPRISANERQRIALAQERVKILAELTTALTDGADDFAIIRHAHPILWDYADLSAAQIAQIRQALQRYERLWAIGEAVRTGALARTTRFYGGVMPEEWKLVLSEEQQKILDLAIRALGPQKSLWKRLLERCKNVIIKGRRLETKTP